MKRFADALKIKKQKYVKNKNMKRYNAEYNAEGCNKHLGVVMQNRLF